MWEGGSACAARGEESDARANASGLGRFAGGVATIVGVRVKKPVQSKAYECARQARPRREGGDAAFIG